MYSQNIDETIRERLSIFKFSSVISAMAVNGALIKK